MSRRRFRSFPSRVHPRSAVLLATLALVLPGAAFADRGPIRPQIEFPAPSFDGPVEAETIKPGTLFGRFDTGYGAAAITVAPNNQSESSIAIDGSQVVVGFNDFNGFGSGAAYSGDGGMSFTYYGLLPADPNTEVLGDPSLAVWKPSVGPAVFYYASLFFNALGQQSLCIHRSADGGATWEGPFEVSSAPNGADYPDREWIAVDPETGRLLISWTHFGVGISMRASFSDDAATGSPPTWSPAVTYAARPQDGQSSFIAASSSSNDVYVVWESYPYTGFSDTRVSFAKSADNGANWSAPADVSPGFWHHLSPWGFDRWLWSVTGMAINPMDGGVEVVYAASQTGDPSSDFGDIYHFRSPDGGMSWTTPKVLNVFPGADRPQCFPTVAAAPDGRVDVYWYDLSCGSGREDWTDLYYAFSNDYGATWSSPVPTTSRPFHNESGNNYGWPHQGDYGHAFSTTSSFGAFAWMNEPSPVGYGADVLVPIAAPVQQVAPLRVRPGTVVIGDDGCGANDGQLVAGETANFAIPLENIGRSGLTGIWGTLSSTAAGVTITKATRPYPDLASGAVGDPLSGFAIRLDSSYPCGVSVPLRLDLTADGVASTFVELDLPTGVVASSTVLLDESFEGVAPPALPAGWTTSSLCPPCPPAPWVTDAVMPASGSFAAYVPEIAATTLSRLQAPNIAVPAGTDYVDVTFDVAHQLAEEDARFAPSGISLAYQLDGVGGSRFATSDAVEFDYPYTHNIARWSGDGAGDRSAWSGVSGGGPTPVYQAARVRIPAMGGHSIRLRFDLSTAGPNVGGGGAWIDNVKITAVTLGCGGCLPQAGLLACRDGYVANGFVQAIVESDGKIYLGGGFTRLGPAMGGGVPIDAATGAVEWSPLVAGEVNAAVPDGSGGWFIGGDFTHVDGKARANLAHLLSDHSVSDWNPGANSVVWTLAIDGGTVYAGGDFTWIAGTIRNRIAALDATTGLATSWDPNSNGTVLSLGLYGGTVYAAGSFSAIGGSPRANIAALSVATGLASVWTSGAAGQVNTLAVSATGVVFAGGEFNQINATSRNYVAAFDGGDGTLLGWNPNSDGIVNTLTVSGGTVYAGGEFDVIGGQTRHYLAALDATTGSATPWAPSVNSLVRAIATSGSSVFVGGFFTTAAGAPRNCLAALDASTGNVLDWDPNPNSTVRALASEGGTVFVGGPSSFGGVGRRYLAALDAATGIPTAWDPNPDGTVLALVADGGVIYAGGSFLNIGGQARTRLAALDPMTGLATPWNPDVNGSVEVLAVDAGTVYAAGSFAQVGGQARQRMAALDASTGTVTAWDPSPNSLVSSMVVGGGVVYVGGGFTSVGGQTRSRLAALDPTTGNATAWDPNPNGAAIGLAVDGSTVYVGGDFTTVGGEARSRLAALDVGTGLATSWDPNANARVSTVVPHGGQVFAGGIFTSIGGKSRNTIAALDAGSGAATDWNPTVNKGAVGAISIGSMTTYLGGSFNSADGAPRTYLACLIQLDQVGVPSSGMPGRNLSLQVVPNPAKHSATFDFTLPERSRTRLTVFDVQGRVVARPMEGMRAPGRHVVTWAGEGLRGRTGAGLYFVRLEAGGRSITRRLVRID